MLKWQMFSSVAVEHSHGGCSLFNIEVLISDLMMFIQGAGLPMG
jgi:hypothetical protein